MSGTESWILVERAGALWGLPRGDLARLERGLLALTDGAVVRVDEIRTVVRDLVPRPIAPSVRRWLPAPVESLAVWKGRPVALVRPSRGLPACLAESAYDTREESSREKVSS